MPLSRASRFTTASVLPGLLALTLALTLALPLARTAQAQGVHPALLIGVGRGSWSGPYAAGSKLSSTLAGAIDWDVKPRLTLRAELGIASRQADMNALNSIFDEQGTLSFLQPYFGVITRVPLSSRDRGWHSYAEAGLVAYTNTSCDVDLTGGPGFFGGATYACGDWVPDLSNGPAPIAHTRSGVRPLVGAGMTRRRIGATMRLEPMGVMARTPSGNITSTSVTLNVEWTFGRAGK